MECPQESETLQALQTGVWSEDLSAHAKTCASCSEQMRFFHEFHALPALETKMLPFYRVVWVKAQWQKREQAQKKLKRIQLGTKIVMGLGFGAIVLTQPLHIRGGEFFLIAATVAAILGVVWLLGNYTFGPRLDSQR